MERRSLLHDQNFTPPLRFFECLIRDIPAASWAAFLNQEPNLKGQLLEGFSARPDRLPHLLRQPQLVVRLRRLLLADRTLLESLLQTWGHEQLGTLAFLEMLDADFVLDNFDNLKNLIGPERYFSGLHLLGYLEEVSSRGLIQEDFWERHVAAGVAEILIPASKLWQALVEEFPLAASWFDEFLPAPVSGRQQPPRGNGEDAAGRRQGDAKKLRKLLHKLEKLQQEYSHVQEQLTRLRKENEALRTQTAILEHGVAQRIEEALALQHREWFQRYQSVDENAWQETGRRLESILKRADRAFELQQQADERYGTIAEVRQKLLRLELYLREIERIHADSLVVHTEVVKVKAVLLAEKQRLLQLPAMGKVLTGDLEKVPRIDLLQRIRFLEAVPENLSRISQLHGLADRLGTLGLIDDVAAMQEEILHKRRQILEVIYARFQPRGRDRDRKQEWDSLEDFVQSGSSKAYDVYVDGYNILLKVHGAGESDSSPSLLQLREEFIRAVHGKSELFRKIYIVFDGVEDFRDRRGNVEIIYSDKIRGDTADDIIIRVLRKRKDNKALLVTADREIIEATEKWFTATISPYDFYVFVSELNRPPSPGR